VLDLNLQDAILLLMKVILLKDVPKLGQVGDVKEVKNGYAQSMLIPRGLAEMATDKKLDAAQKKKKEVSVAIAEKEAKLNASIKDLNGKSITLKLPVNDKGHLYSQVTMANISEAIKKETGHELPERILNIEKTIKEAGKHQVMLVSGYAQSFVYIDVKPQ
jgi:large subunit ribosomal protein L9